MFRYPTISELKKVGDLIRHTAYLRITPTSVGRSQSRLFRLLDHWDYPHQCGEKLYRIYQRLGEIGLPPPVWGEVSLMQSNKWESRITPTSVGRRIGELSTALNKQDYPHQCGEKLKTIVYCHSIEGLPPPVWGEAS